MLRHRKVSLTLFLLLTTLSIYFASTFRFSTHQRPPPLTPANSTLGFGTILAVSHPTSPRRASLLWAANLTDVDIVIPEQPAWTDADVHNFRASEGSSISRGSALAWMGHLEVLKWFLTTRLETALILEDDTDFSLSIRRTQIPLLSAALRSLLTPTSSSSSSSLPDSYHPSPSTWDLIYPGHCDDIPQPSTYLAHPRVLYTDATTPSHHVSHPDTSTFLSSLNVPGASRIVHRAFWPFCTFAYAVSRRSATSVLEKFGKEKEGGISAFDVQLLEACRDGEFTCYSVSPELFHHTVARSEIARANLPDLSAKSGGGEVVVPERGTWNIGCGARDPQMWVDEADTREREEVRRLVRGMVERGECPVDGVVGEGEWVGCEWEGCGAQS